MTRNPFEALGDDVAAVVGKRDDVRLLTDVVISLEDAGVVRLYAVPGGTCPYPSDVARALYDRGVRVAAPAMGLP